MESPNRGKERIQDIGAPVESDEALPPELEEAPLPDELTGRASKTEEDLETLFENGAPDHLKDGFRGGSGDEPDDLGSPSTGPQSPD